MKTLNSFFVNLIMIGLSHAFLASGAHAVSCYDFVRLELRARSHSGLVFPPRSVLLRDRMSVGDLYPDLRPTQMTLEPHKFERGVFTRFFDTENFYDQTDIPPRVEKYRFDIPLPNGRVHQIDVVLSPTHYTYRGIANEAYATKLVSLLPVISLPATRLIEMSPLMPFDPKGVTFNRGQGTQDGRIILRIETFRSEAHMLLHEHGHNVGFYLYGDIPHPWLWSATMARDREDPSVHTKGPTEDFAESIAIYFLGVNPYSMSAGKEFPARSRRIDSIYRKWRDPW